MERLFSTRHSLQPELVDDYRVLPPFNLKQITESAFQHQVEKIYDASSRQTRGIYDIIGGNNGNWAIRWMLWRVIQSRLAEEMRATSSGADTICSVPSLCSSTTSSSGSAFQAPRASCYAITSSNYDSDSEDWDDFGTRIRIIKKEPDDSFRKSSTLACSTFWMDVMNT